VLRSSPIATDANRERSPTPTQSNVVQSLNAHKFQSSSHSDLRNSPATKRTPPSTPGAPGAPATAEDTASTTLWVETCATAAQWTALGIVEPNDQNGQSVLMEWVERRPNAFYCKVPTSSGRCKAYNAKRDRILSHIRKDHLNFRPFRCRGACGIPNW
jgi:hypothetical protein